MARSNLKNAVDVALAADVSGVDLEIQVTTPEVMPTAPFYLVIDPLGETTREYLYCTAVNGDLLSVSRNLDGTQSTTHSTNDVVRISYVAQILSDVWDAIEGGQKHTISESAPANPGVGDVWVDPAAPGESTYLELAGGTMTGPLVLDADPTEVLGAATKQYVDGSIPVLRETLVFSMGGDAALKVSDGRFVMPYDGQAVAIQAAVGGAPVGASLDVTVNVGTGNQVLSIPDGSLESPQEAVSLDAPIGTAITVEVTQVGSTDPGVGLTVMITLEAT
jgi:hypothetical protein